MAIYLNTNVSSLSASRYLSNSTSILDTIYERLSSGLRINSAADDAAGLQISDRLTSQINGLDQGNRNANDGIALVQTADGALEEITTMLQRIRTLAIEAANGTYSDEDRAAIQAEVSELCAEITRIACKTTYGGEQILAGATGLVSSDGTISLQVGANANDTITVHLSTAFTLSSLAEACGLSYSSSSLGAGIFTTDGTCMVFNVSTASSAQAVLSAIDSLISLVDSKRAKLGAVENRLESTIRNQSNISENESEALSNIQDADYAEETADLASETIKQEAAAAMLAQANARGEIVLTLLGID